MSAASRGRWVGLDVGEKRVGVAVSDALGATAQPLTVIPRRGGLATVEELAGLAAHLGVERFVVGLPLRLDGTDSPQTAKVRAFAARLAARGGIPVFLVDERLTTKQAERALVEGGACRARRRSAVDGVAAALLLQAALSGALLTPVEARA